MLRSQAAVAALILVLSTTSLLLVTTSAAADEDRTALRGLQTSYAHSSSTKRCPSNQRYLSNVQFGCPASCDQPVPRCRAAIGPGCGCPKGMVLAGSSRPHNPKRCILLKQCKKPVTTPSYAPPPPSPTTPSSYCPNNATPLANVNCGRGGSRCPTGYTCNIDPTDRFAVCCPDAKYVPPAPTPPSSSQCPDESTPLANAYCGRGGTPCPTGYGCIIDPADRFAVCCREKNNYMPPLVPPASSCVITGCSGEVCTDNDEVSTICVVPSCATQCVARWGICQADSYTGTCGWDLRANAGRYQQCLAKC